MINKNKKNHSEFVKELAKRTRMLRDILLTRGLENEPGGNKGDLNDIHGFYHAFKTYPDRDISKEDFADMYARTVTFGLVTAAFHCRYGFDLKTFTRHISNAKGILRDIFHFVFNYNQLSFLETGIDYIVELLKSDDTPRILKEYNADSSGVDPIHQFYENFLREYDPGLREKMGVYYTPRPVVSFIVRSIHSILITKLNPPYGLADLNIKVLDPAAGTGAFLLEAAKLAVDVFAAKCGEGTRKLFLFDYLANNLYGFELMPAAYAVAYLKMTYLMNSIGKIKRETADRRFNIYLTDTLEMEDTRQPNAILMASLGEELRLAGKIKKEMPITVILGNPPYSGHSSNNGQWISEKIKDYHQIDGKPLKEKNSKWLQDDYVKFIRFAQHKIDESGKGVVGFITNNGFLDNITFSGMRRSLLKSFDEIYILNLHGSKLKREKSPDGSMDENVFDISVGTAIFFFIKIKGPNEKKDCRVFYSEQYGSRKSKFEYLNGNIIGTINWREFLPHHRFYIFKPCNQKASTMKKGSNYDKFYKITDIFPVHSVGIVTSRDKLTIKNSPETLFQTVTAFSKCDAAKARDLFQLGEDTRDWSIEKAKQDIKESGLKQEYVVPILYRPFDIRYTYYTGKSRGFLCMPRLDVMRHMLRGNIGLVTVRQAPTGEFNHCFVSDIITDARIASTKKGLGYLFPLYLYTSPDKRNSAYKGELFNLPGTPSGAVVNINREIIKLFFDNKEFDFLPTANKLFYYIYGILHSTIYRQTYASELRMDFPRIPFTPDFDLFLTMARWGERLAALHLVKSPELLHCFSKFYSTTGARVKKINYAPGERRLYIDKNQYFTGITPDIWEYRLCGRPVLKQWLNKRKFQSLDAKAIDHIINIACITRLTISFQEHIDRLYPKIEKNL